MRQKISPKTRVILGVVTSLIAIFVTIKPIITTTGFFPMHDFNHFSRLYEYANALQAGHFPVRWSPDFGWGFGMPLFNFYGPLPTQLAYFPFVVGASLLSAVKFSFILAMVLSFVGAYYAFRSLVSRWASLTGAVLYQLAPYHAVDLYVRGALNELYAYALIPFVLGGLIYLSGKPVLKHTLISSLALALLILSHNISVLMLAPFGLIVAISGLYFAPSRFQTLKHYLLSVSLGGLMASFYALPAFLERSWFDQSLILGGFSYYGYHFLYIRQLLHGTWGYGGSILGINDGMTFELGQVGLLAFALGFCILGFSLVANYRREKKIRLTFQLKWLGLVSGLLFLAGFLTTFKSSWIWERVKLLAYLQFPWRFLVMASLLLSLTVSLLADVIKQFHSRLGLVFAGGTVLVSLIFLSSYFRPQSIISATNRLYHPTPEHIQTQLSSVLRDYIPVGVDPSLTDNQATPAVLLANSGITQGDTKTGQVKYVLPASTSRTPLQPVTLPVYYYPGWRVKSDSEFLPTYASAQGLVEFVPGTTSEITLVWSETRLRQLANFLSILGLLFWFAFLIYDIKSRLYVSK